MQSQRPGYVWLKSWSRHDYKPQGSSFTGVMWEMVACTYHALKLPVNKPFRSMYLEI